MMDYFFKDIDFDVGNWYWFRESVIDSKTIKMIHHFISKQELVDGFIRKAEHDKDIRSTKVQWLREETGESVPKDLEDVYNELSTLSRTINDQLWKYSVEGWESFQYAEYRSEESGHYGWHVDSLPRSNGSNSRKLTFVVGLSHKHEYEGGELQIMYSTEPCKFKLGKGDFIIFPAFLLHRVTPVTKGVRKTLVGWGRGPNFV